MGVVVAIVIGLGVVTVLAAGVGLGAYLLVAKAPAPPPPARPAPVSAPVESPLVGPSPLHASPKVPSTAKFEFQSLKSSSGSSFYVLGFVTNTSPHVIDHPKVTAVLHDAGGKEVGSDDGYAERDCLQPGARSPIKILVSDPPKYDRLSYEVVADEATYVPKLADGLQIIAHEEKQSGFGSSWESTGKVKNGGSHGAQFVKVEILAYAKGKLVGVDSTYADGKLLAPGATARFHAYMLYDSPPQRFELSVSGRSVE